MSRPLTLLQKRLWRSYFPVNFAKFLRTPFSQNTSERLLLQVSTDLFTFMKENLFYVDQVDRVNTANVRVTFSQGHHCSHLKSGCFNVNLEKMLHVVYVSLITWLGKSWKVWTQKILTGKPDINLETATDKSSFSQMFFKKRCS